MTAPPTGTVAGPLQLARQYAALSGPFEPLAALPKNLADSHGDAAMVASLLASACDTSPTGAENRWLMRMPERRDVLKSLSSKDFLLNAIASRRAAGTDDPTDDLLAVLLDQPPLSRSEIEAALVDAASRDQLERIVVALDRAGDLAKAHDLLNGARSALAEFDSSQRRRRIAERGFYGRKTERKHIAEWLERPAASPPVTCLFVTGGPGIGKSSLLGESVRQFHEGHQPLLLRLDFDRAGLSVQDQLGLTMEAARQLAEQLGVAGTDLVNARLAAAISHGSIAQTASQRESVPFDLIRQIGKSAGSSGRPVLVVLDTLEVLRGRGETHPQRLFSWLDQLVVAGLAPIRVIAAGRGDALDCCRERIGWSTELSGLLDAEARTLLDRLGVPPTAREEVIDLAEGNPLKLRLGAEIAVRMGTDQLPRRERNEGVTAAFLYRFLLSRIDDPDLQQLAHPGLIVRRISAELIRDVLAPKLRLGRITVARAEQLLEALATQHWLVEADAGAPGFLKHRGDMRTMLLPLLYRNAPKKCASIDEAAMRWFARRSEPWCQVEAVYHRLQLMRTRGDPPSIPWGIAAQFDEEMLAELPEAARDLVLATRGERTGQHRSQGAPIDPADDAGLARELLGIVQRQDWTEGQYIVFRAVEAGGIDPRSEAAEAIRAFLWRSGRWGDARRWLKERDRLVTGDEDLAALPPVLALPRLEMRAEFEPRALRWQLVSGPDIASRLQEAAIAASDNAARHGALAFLLSRCSVHWFLRASSRDSDLVAAADAVWGNGDGHAEAEAAFELGRERIRGRAPVLPGADGVSRARLMATLTPYTAFAGNLAVADQHQWLVDDARIVETKLMETGALLAPGNDAGSAARINNPVTDLAELGLFAEWAVAAAFLHGDRDLRLIGRAAERWRRTMAGDWRYGGVPPGWSRTIRLDETIRERVRTLMKSPDPVDESVVQLGLWTAQDGGRRPARDRETGIELLERLRERLRCALAEAATKRATDDAEAIAVLLLRRQVPAAFAPSLAVLISRKVI